MSHWGKRDETDQRPEQPMRLASDSGSDNAFFAFFDPSEVDRLVKWDMRVLVDVKTNRLSEGDRAESAAKFFKHVLVFACTTEALNHVGCRKIGDIKSIDARALIKNIERAMGRPWGPMIQAVVGEGPRPAPDPEQRILSTEEARALVGSFWDSTNSSTLLASAKAVGLDSEIDFLLNKLHEFLRRTDPFLKSRIEAVADRYKEGALSLEQLANVLGVDEMDALFLLDEYGIGRPAAALQLSDDVRKARLEAIERDRARREGKPRGDASEATAAAVSNARLEGVDARGCLTNR